MPLKAEFALLQAEICRTLTNDNFRRYPESVSDYNGAIMDLMKRFDIKARPVPLDRADMFEGPHVGLHREG